MASRVVNPAPRVVDLVRTRRVHATEVAVHPWQTSHECHNEATDGQERCSQNKEDGTYRDPEGASEENEWGKEDEPDDWGCDSEASEEEQDGSGDEKCEEANELGGVWCMVLEFT